MTMRSGREAAELAFLQLQALPEGLQPNIRRLKRLSISAAAKESASKDRGLLKVRTGCITCKARRVKCDEARPHCKRCLTSKKKCGGYPHVADAVEIYPPARKNDVSCLPAMLPQFNGSSQVQILIHLMPLTTLGQIGSDHLTDGLDFRQGHTQRRVRYIFELPCRSGYDEALDSAVECLATALIQTYRKLTGSQQTESSSNVGLYVKALRLLQQALEDPRRSLSAETLCAAKLLSIYEILVRDKNQASIQHVLGASRLIEHRGPSHFTTEFDKSLFAAHAPILIGEAFFGGRHCFLEQPEWQDLLESCYSQKYAGERDRMAVSFNKLASLSPGLIMDCYDFLKEENHQQKQHVELLSRIQSIQKQLSDWYDQWSTHLFNPINESGAVLTEISPFDYDRPGRRLELFTTYETNIILLNRLYVALSGDGARAMEQGVLTVARAMIGSNKSFQGGTTTIQPIAHGVRAAPSQESLISFNLFNANVALKTAQEWAPHIWYHDDEASQPLASRPLIPTDFFCKWLTTMGMSLRPKS